MTKNVISALILAVGLLALGLCLRSGITAVADRGRVVNVRGLAEMEVKANKVTWPLVYNVMGDNLPTLYGEIEQTNGVIERYLTSNGIPAAEITVSAPEVVDQEADRYSSARATYRYNATQTITVASGQVDKVRELINRQGELLKKGIAIVTNDWNHQIIYEYTDLNSIKPEMIAEATRNAHQAAEKFAEDSGSKIGKIKDAQQGQFSINDRDPYTPFIKNIRVVTYVNYYIED